MQRQRYIAVLSAFLASLLAAGLLFAQAPAPTPDTVVLADKKEKTGQVAKETYKELSLQDAKGGTETIQWANIADVRYGDRPGSCISGDSAFSRGDYAQALEGYRQVVADVDGNKARAIFRQHGLIGVARSLVALRKHDDAVKAFNDLLTKEPDSRFLRDAHLGIVAALRAKGDAAGATNAITRAATEAKSKSLEEEFSIRLTLLKAGLLEDDKKWADAQNEYSSIARKADKYPVLSAAAKIGLGRSMLNVGQDQKAMAHFTELQNAASSNRYLLCGALSGLGDCAFAAGEKSKQPNDYRTALGYYVKAGVIGFPGKGEPSAEHERALFMAGCAYQALSTVYTEEQAKRFFAKRAELAFRELIAEYPASTYVDPAGKRLKEVLVTAGAAEEQ
ncbi:MAG: tetratricopeptide repeat protein [Planctomycetota bacterium]|nr:tetratricopeptide repeat protein [Planctomycetota bacterium]